MNSTVLGWKDKVLVFMSSSVLHHVSYSTVIVAIICCAVAFKIFQYVRSQFPVRVNCWFCNTNCKVLQENQNSWYCKSCRQYNGFAEDGSYNKVIPEQFYEGLNAEFAEKSTKKLVGNFNGLCKNCNVNQELKRAQLAAFEPLDPNNYDWEVEAFSELLEKNYKLCSSCERVLSTTLENQIKSLNLNQLITTGAHKLANSSVRFLNHQTNPVDLVALLRSTRHSLLVSCLLSAVIFFETCDKTIFMNVLSEKEEELFVIKKWSLEYLTYVYPAIKYLLDHLSKFNMTAVTTCSLVQFVRRQNNRIVVDYITQLGWMTLLCLELSFIFIETQLDIKSAQIVILSLIFTVSLWKYLYFKYFFWKSNSRSPKSKPSPPMKVMTSPQPAENDCNTPNEKTYKETPQRLQRINNKPKNSNELNLDTDLGIGSLNLGTNQTGSPVNSYTRNVFSVSNDNFPSKRKPLILPSRLNFNLKNELNEINIPFSRPSSQSSGYETMNKSGYDSQNGSLIGDEDYDIPLKRNPPLQQLQLSNYGNVMPPFVSSQTPSPYELYSYYHFTAKFQASYGAQAPHNLSTCSSCAGPSIQMNSNKWFLIIFLMFVLLILQESFILFSILNR